MTKKCDGIPCFGGSARSNKIECRCCRKSFHAKCANLNGSLLKAIRDLPGVFWFCCACRAKENPLDQQAHSPSIDLVLHRLNSLSRLVYAQIEITRSLCRSLGNDRDHIIASKHLSLNKSLISNGADNNFENALDKMQFEFSKDFNDLELVTENTYAQAPEGQCITGLSAVLNDNNKRDRTSCSDLSSNAEKRMKVDVPIGTCVNSNTVALPLAVHHNNSAQPKPNAIVSTSQSDIVVLSDVIVKPATTFTAADKPVAETAADPLPTAVIAANTNFDTATANVIANATSTATSNIAASAYHVATNQAINTNLHNQYAILNCASKTTSTNQAPSDYFEQTHQIQHESYAPITNVNMNSIATQTSPPASSLRRIDTTTNSAMPASNHQYAPLATASIQLSQSPPLPARFLHHYVPTRTTLLGPSESNQSNVVALKSFLVTFRSNLDHLNIFFEANNLNKTYKA